MTRARRLGAAVALIAMASASAAQAGEARCFTPDDLTAIVRYALPGAITAASKVCRPLASAEGFLANEAPALIAHYRDGQPQAWPQARAAIMRVGLGTLTGRDKLGPLAALLPDGALQGLADGFIDSYVSQNVRASDCGDVEDLLRLTAPLPPANTARLIALAVRRLDRPGAAPRHRPALPLCPIEPAAPPAPPPAP